MRELKPERKYDMRNALTANAKTGKIPALDKNIPGKLETATFGLG